MKNKELCILIILLILLGIVIISAIFVFVGNLLADVIYEYVDPRLRSDDND